MPVVTAPVPVNITGPVGVVRPTCIASGVPFRFASGCLPVHAVVKSGDVPHHPGVPARRVAVPVRGNAPDLHRAARANRGDSTIIFPVPQRKVSAPHTTHEKTAFHLTLRGVSGWCQVVPTAPNWENLTPPGTNLTLHEVSAEILRFRAKRPYLTLLREKGRRSRFLWRTRTGPGLIRPSYDPRTGRFVTTLPPFCQSAGTIDQSTTFDPSDFRNTTPLRPENREANQARVELLGKIAERKKGKRPVTGRRAGPRPISRSTVVGNRYTRLNVRCDSPARCRRGR